MTPERIPNADVEADGELSDEDVLAVSVHGLKHLVEQKMREFGVRLGFTTGFLHPRPLSPSSRDFPQYRPQLTPLCPNLGGALWYQLGALMEDKHPLRNCPECGLPFVGRADKKTCSDACRQAESRRER